MHGTVSKVVSVLGVKSCDLLMCFKCLIAVILVDINFGIGLVKLTIQQKCSRAGTHGNAVPVNILARERRSHKCVSCK